MIHWQQYRDWLSAKRSEGLTGTAIADMMQGEHGVECSRSAVIGACYRMRIPTPNPANGGHALRDRRAAQPRKPKAEARPKRNVEYVDFSPSGAKHLRWDTSPLPRVRPLALSELGSRDCKWPLYDGPDDDRLFCGAQQSPGSSYCTTHRFRSAGFEMMEAAE